MSDPLSQTGRDVPPPLEPPQTWSGIFSQLGPGLIIAAAIVGSGELIATTLTGARAGITLLWLIILGCVVKVFAQIEIGRFTISTGTPTLSALAQVPGPRIRGRGNWLVWYWFVMWFCSIGQLGGIVGGVGQVMALVRPITQQGADFQKLGLMETEFKLAQALDPSAVLATDATSSESITTKREQYQKARDEYIARYGRKQTTPGNSAAPPTLPRPWDDRWWAVPVAVVTSWMLIYGGYSLIQSAATAMVAVFTLVTIFTVIGMQWMPEWSIPMADWWKGLSFGLPEGDRGRAIATALATVGIIGVGAAELIQYPYWCLEKGYARFTGPNDGSDAWLQRARGWLRVMHYDVWVSMVIYTTATLGFFALGVGILHRSGLVPEGSQLIQTLSVMYEPVLGAWAPPIFLLGAFMVLYSTFFVANASHARTFADGLSVTGFLSRDPAVQQHTIRFLSGLFPLLCLVVYWILPNPAWLVLISGSAQAIMLPMLGFAALYFRYAKSLPELRSGVWFDVGLWVSVLLLLGIGLSSFLSEFRTFFGI